MKALKVLAVLALLIQLSMVWPSAGPDRVAYQGKDGPGRGKHIVLISGDDEYRSEEAQPMPGKILAGLDKSCHLSHLQLG